MYSVILLSPERVEGPPKYKTVPGEEAHFLLYIQVAVDNPTDKKKGAARTGQAQKVNEARGRGCK